MKILTTILLALLLAPCALAQASTDTVKGIAGNTKNTTKGTQENQSTQAGKGFDTKLSTAPAVKASTSTATVQSKVNEARAQQAAQDKATAKKYPAIGKEPGSK